MTVLEKGHITDSALEDYALDHLTEAELEVVEEHILICPTCQDRLAEVDDFVKAFRLAHSRMGAGGASVQSEPGLAISDRAKPGFAIVNLDEMTAGGREPWQAPASVWYQRPLVWAALAIGLAAAVAAPFWWPGGTAEPAPQEIQLIAQRGAEGVAEAHPGRLVLNLDLRGITDDPVTVEIARWDGRTIWSRDLGLGGVQGGVKPDAAFVPGQYWVRVRSNGTTHGLLREFGLHVGTH